MVKVVVLLPRRSDMSRADFERHLRETHRPLITKLPGLRRLVLNYVQPDPTGSPPAYDAVAEDWFDDPAALGAALGSPAGQAVANDAANFLDIDNVQFMIVEEEEILLTTDTSTAPIA